MEKLHKSIVYGMMGASGGVAGVLAPAGLCGSACSNCMRCAGIGILLIALALLKRKGGAGHGLVKECD